MTGRVVLALMLLSGACYDAVQVECSNAEVDTQPLYGGAATAEYLALGTNAEQAVVRLDLLVDGALDQCSATIVQEGWALTAAHCFRGRPVQKATLRTNSDESQTRSEPEVVVREHHVHPTLDLAVIGFDPSSIVDGRRIAIGESAPRVGAMVQLAGFGLTEYGSVGNRRFAVAQIESMSATEVVVRWSPGAGACIGDSGGPLLMRNPAGEPVVAAVLSHGSATCGGQDVYDRVDNVHDWLKGHIGDPRLQFECGALGPEGRCFDGMAVWCDAGGHRFAEPCTGTHECSWSTASRGYRCGPQKQDSCGELDAFGACVGNAAVRCVAGELVHEDCDLCGATCMRSATSGAVHCGVFDNP